MAQPFRSDGCAVERAAHNDERPVPALSSLVAESAVKVEEFAEGGAPHHVHYPLVVFRPFRRVSIRSVILKLVREIPAGNDDGTSTQRLDCTDDRLTETVMFDQRKARKSDSDHRHRAGFSKEISQRDHRAVIKPSIALPHRSCGNPQLTGLSSDTGSKFRIVIRLDLHLRMTERTKIAFGMMPRGNVEIITVQYAMRRQHDKNVGLQFRTTTCRFLIRRVGSGKLSLLASSDLGHDDRRMRHCKCSYDWHAHSAPFIVLSLAPRGNFVLKA